MRRLSHWREDEARVTAMNKYHEINTLTRQAVISIEKTAEPCPQALEVNVIYTGSQETAAALKVADSLAEGLGACVHLQAAISVPIRLSLDQSPISISFMENRLRELIDNPELDWIEHTLHLYVCRDSQEALLCALRPHSLVVIGGRKHWWPAQSARLEKVLRAKGHRVVFVDMKKHRNGNCQ